MTEKHLGALKPLLVPYSRSGYSCTDSGADPNRHGLEAVRGSA